MSTVLIISHDRIADRMGGVGIRYYEIARALAQQGLSVTLAAPAGSHLPHSYSGQERLRFETFATLADQHIQTLIQQHSHLIAYPDAVWECRSSLDRSNVFVIVDGYDITLFEQLELSAALQRGDGKWLQDHIERLRYVLHRGDFFVTATERQRDFWLGLLTLAGRVDLATYRADPSLRNLIDLVPYGVPADPPVHTRPVMRGVIQGIGEDDFVVLWGGGAWQWLDPVTLIQAAALVVQERPDIKFYFPGIEHPAPELVGTMPVQQEMVALSEQLGLKDRTVFFGDWVDYADWQNYLLESDCGISLHRDHLESRFAARTRVMSYLWAGLPMILTRGDELAERLERQGTAILVPPGDIQGVAKAILDLARHNVRAESFDWVRESFSWLVAVQPLIRKCQSNSSRHQNDVIGDAKQHENGFKKLTTSLQSTPLQGLNPTLHLPQPHTSLSQVLFPVIRSAVLWYVESIAMQQTQLNSCFLSHIGQHESKLEQLQAQLSTLAVQTAQFESMPSKLEQIQAQLSTLADRLVRLESWLIETGVLLSDLIEQLVSAALQHNHH